MVRDLVLRQAIVAIVVAGLAWAVTRRLEAPTYGVGLVIVVTLLQLRWKTAPSGRKMLLQIFVIALLAVGSYWVGQYFSHPR